MNGSKRWYILTLLLTVAACQLAGCGGSGDGGAIPAASTSPLAPSTEIEATFEAGLPAPGVLLEQYTAMSGDKRSSYIETDLIQHGKDSDSFSPYRNIVDVSNSVEFHPNWSEATGMDPGNLSFCMYPFVIPGYDRSAQVRYGWSDPPADIKTVWLGLANWTADTWDWYQAEADGVLSLPSFDPYISASGDYSFIYMLHASTDVSALEYIGLGPKQVTASLTAAPKYSLAPVHATASSAASMTAVGTIAKHEFDWDDDGIYEDDAGPVGASVYDVGSTGSYSVAVRVTNSFGEQDTAEDSYTVIEPWQHTWGLEELDTFYAVSTDGTEYCYAAGSLTSSSNGLQIVLLKYSLAGAFQWARAWGGLNDDCALGVQCYQDKVFITGYTENYGVDGKDVLVQCWNTSGDVEWTRTWGGNEDDIATAVALTSNAVYVCGEERVTNASDSNVLLLKYTHGGELEWEKSWDAGQNDAANDVVSYYDILSHIYRLYLTGNTEDSGNHSRVLYMNFTEDGSLVTQRAWVCNEASGVRGNAIAVAGIPPVLYIAGQTSTAYSLMLEVDIGTNATAVSWGGVRNDAAYDLIIKDDHILVCGATETSEEIYGAYIMDLSPTGGYNGYRMWACEMNAKFHAIAPFPGTGVLLAGSGTSADSGEWLDWPESPSQRTGTWSSLSGTEPPLSGVRASPLAGGFPVTYGVKDTGAGENYIDDTALVSFGMP